MTRKRQNCQGINRFRFASLLSPSRDPSHARPQFLELLARLLTTEIEAPDEEAGTNYALHKHRF